MHGIMQEISSGNFANIHFLTGTTITLFDDHLRFNFFVNTKNISTKFNGIYTTDKGNN